MNPFTDKYFTKSKEVALHSGNDPIVSYRVFMRFDGIAALEPMVNLVSELAPEAEMRRLPEGTPFKAEETVAVIMGRFSEIVELETMYLQFAALPCYCAREAKRITDIAKDKIVMDFAARHLFSPISAALASYGARVGGIPGSSTDTGMNAEAVLNRAIRIFKRDIERPVDTPIQGMGTTPHALLAVFKGDYEAMADAYINKYPVDNFIALADYNNREVDDSLLLLKKLGKNLKGIRIDTCGENYAQIGYHQDGTPKFASEKGVTIEGARALKSALVNNGGDHVKVFLSSGFNAEKTAEFMDLCPSSFDGIGTGSFIPKLPSATADIFKVDGKKECKIGREWGYEDAMNFLPGAK
jgi:nicotinate phosphoribosyltransferase